MKIKKIETHIRKRDLEIKKFAIRAISFVTLMELTDLVNRYKIRK